MLDLPSDKQRVWSVPAISPLPWRWRRSRWRGRKVAKPLAKSKIFAWTSRYPHKSWHTSVPASPVKRRDRWLPNNATSAGACGSSSERKRYCEGDVHYRSVAFYRLTRRNEIAPKQDRGNVSSRYTRPENVCSRSRVKSPLEPFV